MAEEPLAHKNQPPSPSADAEYDRIYDTVSETAPGRRFLEEYARRSRPAVTEVGLAAIERLQTAMRVEGGERIDLLLEMADMARAIAQARAEIAAIQQPARAGRLDNATEELDSIVQTTESATSRILAATEQIQEIGSALREIGGDMLRDRLDTQATEIYTACTFQDLTGQRIRKVIQLLRYLEERINATIGAGDSAPLQAPAVHDLPEPDLAQADVDAMMQPDAAAGEERQDATLEDISRFMLALEPLMGLHQEAAENSIGQEPETTSAEHMQDVRPELSVTDAVMAEADEVRALAHWAVEPTAPVQAKPEPSDAEPAVLAEWIVEDPLAPRPEAEPAWMILHRLEAELDADQDEPLRAVRAPPSSHAAMPADPLDALQGALEAAAIKLSQQHDAGRAPASDDADDFLFEPETRRTQSDPADVRDEPKLQEKPPQHAKATPHALGISEWDGGNFSHPALATPRTPQPVEAEAPKPARATYDPLAPLRALSDEEKIALFS